MARRLVLFDRTQTGRPIALTTAWSTGVKLYRGLGRIDAAYGAATWAEALDWVVAQNEEVAELQFWGHGTWGEARFDRDLLDATALAPGHALYERLVAVRERLVPGALLWLRCCEAFGARRGIDLAERLADFFGVRVAGHTYLIGFHQSGLRGLHPGARADWNPAEGIAEGSPQNPVRARWSRPFAPRTITCLRGSVPRGWLTGE
jgi:hypothetical protein